MRRSLLLFCVIGCAMSSGCSTYDGSRFQWQSGGLPFAGMTFAIGNDEPDAPVVRRADGTLLNPSSVMSRVSESATRLRDAFAGGSPGEERVLVP